jgi:hypothetical protein
MSFNDLDNYFMPDKTPEPPPEEETPKRNRKFRESDSTITFDSGLPCDVDAEKTVMGAVLIDNENLKEISISL